MGGLIDRTIATADLWMVKSRAGNLSCYPIAAVSESPSPRVGHAALLVGNAFIVFGGDTKIDESDTLDDTLYLLDTESRQWSKVIPSGPRLSGRYAHTLNILGSKIYIFGGQAGNYFFNDLIAFDLKALLSPPNQSGFLCQNTSIDDEKAPSQPSARTNHSMVSYNDQLYLFAAPMGRIGATMCGLTTLAPIPGLNKSALVTHQPHARVIPPRWSTMSCTFSGGGPRRVWTWAISQDSGFPPVDGTLSRT
jgi:hypothetical protein